MRALTLIRHSLTEANEKRLYCGATDLPLSKGGRRLVIEAAKALAPPEFDLRVSSGMRRAEETLRLLCGVRSDRVIPELREMDFGAFELHSYEELKRDPDYLRWIEDDSGTACCPGGESTRAFHARVLRGGESLLALEAAEVLAVCHGGVIVALMQAWFPQAERGFYDWQPAACHGYRIAFASSRPVRFEPL